MLSQNSKNFNRLQSLKDYDLLRMFINYKSNEQLDSIRKILHRLNVLRLYILITET